MNKLTLASLAALLSFNMLLQPTFAGVSKSTSTGSGGFAVRSAPRPQTSGPVTYKSFSPSNTSKNSTASVAKLTQKTGGADMSTSGTNYRNQGRRSLLESSTTKPSPQLQNIIREKEIRSGPGWLGTGFLIYLLSQHDLPSSDRQWIQAQIDDAKSSSDDPVPAPLELSNVVFNWGVPGVFHKGETSLITVSASLGTEAVLRPVSCTMNGNPVVISKEKAVLEWTPDTQTTIVVSCESDGLHDMRMFAVENSKTTP